jgi:hypothetical protein
MNSCGKPFFNSLSELGHGIVLQKPEHPDELPGPISYFFFLCNKAATQGVKTLRQVHINQRSGVVQTTRLSFQKGQIVEIVKKDSFLVPGTFVYCYHLVPMA